MFRRMRRNVGLLPTGNLGHSLPSGTYGMTTQEFRKRGKEMVDYICDYRETVSSREVTPDVKPGFLRERLPNQAPQKPEDWDEIMHDVEECIVQGMTHWQHPGHYGYVPIGCSYPSLLGDMLSGISGTLCFSWDSCPSHVELEVIVMDWFAKAIGLPYQFLHESGTGGGGVIQTSCSECVLVSMLAARHNAIKKLQAEDPNNNPENPKDSSCYLPQLVAYTSKLAHSCVEKAALISLIKIRLLEPDDSGSLRGYTLQKKMEEDAANGLIPFFVSTTLGTTACCSFDNLSEIGPVCRKFPNVWMHIDAAYAGTALICPEFKYLLNGVEYADSFNTSPNKWMLTHPDCVAYWVRDSEKLISSMTVNPFYLKRDNDAAFTDFWRWGIPLSRRFRAAKLWFVFRNYGIEGLQENFRIHCHLAKFFEQLVNDDERFEIVNEVKMGLVCFRIYGTNAQNEALLKSINNSRDILLTPAIVRNKYILRLCIQYQYAEEGDMIFAWKVIQKHATKILNMKITETKLKENINKPEQDEVNECKQTKLKNYQHLRLHN